MINNVINTAKELISNFCQVNHLSLNEDILEVPVYEIKDFFIGRDQSGENYSEEEARNDLGNSEAFFLQVDDLTGKPAILYDKGRLESLAFKEQVQTLIHEFLHYNGSMENYFDYSLEKALESEAEIEALSFLITFYSNCEIEEGLENLSEKVDPEVLSDSYEAGFGELILRKIYVITEKEIRRYFK